jgi:hypothetical protein
LADDVNTHVPEQSHLVIESSPNCGIWLFPQAVGVIRTGREVIPIHTLDEKLLSIDNEGVLLIVEAQFNGILFRNHSEAGLQQAQNRNGECSHGVYNSENAPPL